MTLEMLTGTRRRPDLPELGDEPGEDFMTMVFGRSPEEKRAMADQCVADALGAELYQECDPTAIAARKQTLFESFSDENYIEAFAPADELSSSYPLGADPERWEREPLFVYFTKADQKIPSNVSWREAVAERAGLSDRFGMYYDGGRATQELPAGAGAQRAEYRLHIMSIEPLEPQALRDVRAVACKGLAAMGAKAPDRLYSPNDLQGIRQAAEMQRWLEQGEHFG